MRVGNIPPVEVRRPSQRAASPSPVRAGARLLRILPGRGAVLFPKQYVEVGGVFHACLARQLADGAWVACQQRGDLFDKYSEQLGMDYRDLNELKLLEPYLKLIKENEPDIIPLQSIVASWNKTAWEIATGVSTTRKPGSSG